MAAKYVPQENLSFDQQTTSSWTGGTLNGNRTSNGEQFNSNSFTAAHPTLPFSTVVRVTNNQNNQSVVVRINDRGPFNGRDGIDLSQRAASQIGLSATQGNPVRVTVLRDETAKLAQLTGGRIGQLATASQPTNNFMPIGSSSVTSSSAPLSSIQAAPISSVSSQPVTSAPINIAPISAPSVQTSSIQQPITSTPVRASSSNGGTGSVSDLPDLPTVGTQSSSNVSTASPTSQSTASSGGSGFFVQAGSFSSEGNAEQLKGRLASVGSARVAQVSGAYRVLVGPFSDQQAAQAALGRVIGAGSFDATIIQQ